MAGDRGGSGIVVAVDALRVNGELEQDALANVLETAGHATDLGGLDGLVLVVEIELGDDDLAVCHGREQKVLGERDQVGVVLGRALSLLRYRAQVSTDERSSR